jgi:uncharacterized OB-fold protein
MKFGIEQVKGKTICANCGRMISPDLDLKANYCFYCGTPLSITAIEVVEQRQATSQVRALTEIAKSTTSEEVLQIVETLTNKIQG